MSDILIKGMGMPKERESFTLTIKYNGLVFDTETGMQVAEAHEISPHGRLIDADELIRDNGLKEIPEYHEVVLAAGELILNNLFSEETDKFYNNCVFTSDRQAFMQGMTYAVMLCAARLEQYPAIIHHEQPKEE